MTGFDNIEFSTVTTPSITTVDQPRIRLGLMACELLVEKIANPALPSKGRAAGDGLIVRESTSNSRAVAPEPFRRSFFEREAPARHRNGAARAATSVWGTAVPFTHRGVRY